MDPNSGRDFFASFFDLARADNDPVMEALGYSRDFVSFLTTSSFSLNLLLSRRILSSFSEWKSADRIAGKLQPSIGALPFESHLNQSETAEEPEQEAKFFSNQLMVLHPRGRHSLEAYNGRTVVLASLESENNLVLQTKEYLEIHQIQAHLVELEGKDLVQLRPRLESTLAGVSNVIGAIVFPRVTSSDIDDDPLDYAAKIQDTLGRLLLLFQALIPKLNALTGKMPLPFCGAVTFNAITEDSAPDPFHASICSFWEVLKAPLKNYPIIKVMDFKYTKDFSPSELLEDLLTEDRQGTVAIRNGQRFASILCPSEVGREVQEGPVDFNEDSVVLAIGGGTGITAECLENLVREVGPLNIILSGRTSPGLSPFWQSVCQEAGSSKKDDLLRAALSKIKGHMTDPDLGKVHRELDHFQRSLEIHGTIRKLRNLGCKVQYWPADVGDGISLRNLIDQALHWYGKIDLLIYSAGVDRSQSLMNKDLESFNSVLHPKVTGAVNLLSLAAESEAIKRIVLFSSAYAWFGFEGSVDYVVGNRFLAAAGQYWNSKAKTHKISSIYWGPWAEVGLAASDRLAEYFQNFGMRPLTPQGGAKLFTKSLSHGSKDVCILDTSVELQYVSDVVMNDTDVLEANRRLNEGKSRFPLLDRIISIEPDRHLKAIKKFSLSNDKYLMDHVFDRVPIVPGVIGMELMAEAANFLFPELVVTGLREVLFKTAIKCYDRHSTMVEVEVTPVNVDGETKNLHVTVRELIPKSSVGYHLKRDPSYEAEVSLGQSRQIRIQTADRTPLGLEINIPTDKMLALCEAEGYHFGPIMTGQSETMTFAQGCAESCFTLSDREALDFPSPYNFSIYPQALDVGMQCQLRRAIFQHGQKQLPYHVTSLKFYESKQNPNRLLVKTKYLPANQKEKQAYFSLEITDEHGHFLAESEGWAYITGQSEANPWTVFDDGFSQCGHIQGHCHFSIHSLTGQPSDIIAAVNLPPQWISDLPEIAEQGKVDFIAARKALWNLLSLPEVSSLLPCPKEELSIHKDTDGAPYLASKSEERIPIAISLAHSNGFGAAACSSETLIGIDIESFGAEWPKGLVDGERLNQNEIKRLNELSAQTGYQESILSVVLFSLKEAVYKCLSHVLGEGSSKSQPMTSYELVEISPYGTAQIKTDAGVVDCRHIILGGRVISLASF